MDNITAKPVNITPPALNVGRKVIGDPKSRPGAGIDEDAGRLTKACADFEAIFIQQLFKTMRASVPESGLMDGGRAEALYTSMMDEEVAREMAHGRPGAIGLADQMKARLMRYLTMGP